MELFTRDGLVAALPAWSLGIKGISSAPLRSYLSHYGLLPLAEAHGYQAGLVSVNGVRTCIQRFSHTGASRGCAVVLHGYMDHMGLYGHLIRHLLDSGLDVVAYDLAGHGLSAGYPLAIDDFRHYAGQLQGVIDTVGPEADKPLYLLGLSTGGGIVVAHHLVYGDSGAVPVSHRILMAPLIRPALWRSIRRQFHMLRHFLKQVPRRYTANSHDAAFLRFTRQNDPLQHGDIPLNWIAAMLEWGNWVESAAPMAGSVTCIQGMADMTVDWHHNLRVLSQLYPHMQVELIEDARHHLVNESPEYREPVMACISRVVGGAVTESHPVG